jgi:hypothetical protein
MYKQTLISNLRRFARQRPGLEFGNYGDWKAYRAEMRAITRDLAHAETLLRAVQYDDSITAQDIIEASTSAFSGRLEIEACMHGQSGATTCGKCGHVWCDRCDPAPSAMCHKCNGAGPSRHKPNGLRIDYCTGQYFPTEYRKAVCAVLASALWAKYREGMQPSGYSVSCMDDAGNYVAATRRTFPDRNAAKAYLATVAESRHPHANPLYGAKLQCKGDYLRAHFKREFGRGIASRYFS